MRKLRSVLCILLLSLPLPMTAEAQTDPGLDVEKLSCDGFFDKMSQFSKTNKDTALAFSYWLFGYASGVQNSGKWFQSRYLQFHKSLVDYCRKNRNEPLLVAVRKLDLKM
jgi:HdeA/HdeB family